MPTFIIIGCSWEIADFPIVYQQPPEYRQLSQDWDTGRIQYAGLAFHNELAFQIPAVFPSFPDAAPHWRPAWRAFSLFHEACVALLRHHHPKLLLFLYSFKKFNAKMFWCQHFDVLMLLLSSFLIQYKLSLYMSGFCLKTSNFMINDVWRIIEKTTILIPWKIHLTVLLKI